MELTLFKVALTLLFGAACGYFYLMSGDLQARFSTADSQRPPLVTPDLEKRQAEIRRDQYLAALNDRMAVSNPQHQAMVAPPQDKSANIVALPHKEILVAPEQPAASVNPSLDSFVNTDPFKWTPEQQQQCMKAQVHFTCATRSTATKEDVILKNATSSICDSHVMSNEFTAYVDCRFLKNYKKFYLDNGGWAEHGYITYVRGDKYKGLTQLLLESANSFSEKPLIIFCIGFFVPEWDEVKYPKLIVIHMPFVQLGIAFDFNKIKGMLLSKVRVGMVADGDQLVVPPGDKFFERIPIHINENYPIPMMPVHWMSRDPEGGDVQHYAVFCPEYCEPRSMRWGHAHPAWTYHALPTIGDIYMKAVIDRTGRADEAWLNIYFWERKMTKQFCKFDEFPWSVQNILSGNVQGLNRYGADKKWFPNGIPILAVTTHGVKNPSEVKGYLRNYENLFKSSKTDPNVQKNFDKYVAYMGRQYTPEEFMSLYGKDPNVKCVV